MLVASKEAGLEANSPFGAGAGAAAVRGSWPQWAPLHTFVGPEPVFGIFGRGAGRDVRARLLGNTRSFGDVITGTKTGKVFLMSLQLKETLKY